MEYFSAVWASAWGQGERKGEEMNRAVLPILLRVSLLEFQSVKSGAEEALS